MPAEPQSPQIGALLSALVERVDAVGVGIYDPGEDQLVAAKELPPALFSEVFSALECFEGGWGDWERTLVDDGESHVRCACGRHALELFLINGYWVLVVLTEEPFLSDAAAIIAQFRWLLAQLLPRPERPNRRVPEGPMTPPPAGGGPGGTPPPAELRLPLSWVRRRDGD